jgi:hypothetical protein
VPATPRWNPVPLQDTLVVVSQAGRGAFEWDAAAAHSLKRGECSGSWGVPIPVHLPYSPLNPGLRSEPAAAGSVPAASRDRRAHSQPQLSISTRTSQSPATVPAAPPGISDRHEGCPMRLELWGPGSEAGANEHHSRWVEGVRHGKVASFGLLTSCLGDERANRPVGLGAAVMGVELAQ